MLKDSSAGESSGLLAGAQSNDYISEIYVLQEPTGRVHGKLTEAENSISAVWQFLLPYESDKKKDFLGKILVVVSTRSKDM